jgi:hypothetical protein
MTLEEFCTTESEARRSKPKLFLTGVPDRKASESDLGTVENSLAVRLPESYRSFLTVFGGGRFGFVTIFSADQESEWYLPRQQAAAGLPDGLVPFSDDFAGGLYVFRCAAGNRGDTVFYWTHEDGISRTEFPDIFSFLARYAFSPA